MATAKFSRQLAQSPKEIWNRMGGWATIHDWHPAVASTEVSADGSQRTLTLADGATLLERLVKQDEHSYSYLFVKSPLPVKDYRATIRVRPTENGSTVEWEGTFSPDGISETDAVALIEGIYKAGLDAL